LSFTGDVTRVNWNEYVYEYEDGDRFSPVDGLITEKADISPTYTARAGAEYLIIKPKYVVPIRGGLFYDPEPAKHKPDDFWGITVGSGVAFKWMALDLTYYYRFGNDVVLNTSVDGSHKILIDVKRGDVSQQMVMFSAIAYFE